MAPIQMASIQMAVIQMACTSQKASPDLMFHRVSATVATAAGGGAKWLGIAL